MRIPVDINGYLQIPEDWKRANTVPVYEKRNKDNQGNYRPVSFISVAGKIMEQIMNPFENKWKIIVSIYLSNQTMSNLPESFL